MSSFDDLLNELDAAPTEKTEEENPLRNDCLRRLVDLSKQLEKIALILDPSEKKHPLNGQTVPAEARAKLKGLVNELMQVQGDLQKIEESLLTPVIDPVPSASDDQMDSPAPLREPLPPPTLDEPQNTSPFPPPQEIKIDPVALAALDQEKKDFAAYKLQWETVFSADSAQRAAHPEVQAYYEQMETYFIEKERHLTSLSK